MEGAAKPHVSWTADYDLAGWLAVHGRTELLSEVEAAMAEAAIAPEDIGAPTAAILSRLAVTKRL